MFDFFLSFVGNADQQQQLESPTSTVSFSDMKEQSTAKMEFTGSSSTGLALVKEPENDWISTTIFEGVEEGFTGLLLGGDTLGRSFSADKNERDHGENSGGGECNNYFEDNKNYLDSIFNFVDPPPSSDSQPIF